MSGECHGGLDIFVLPTLAMLADVLIPRPEVSNISISNFVGEKADSARRHIASATKTA